MSGIPYRVNKKSNEYADAVPFDAPKTVFAALAFSFAMNLQEDNADAAAQLLAREWVTLHEQGIVPQRPPAAVFALAALSETGGGSK